jgi:hypothetical protein
LARGQGSKEVIVLHKPEGALNHCVLKVDRRLHGGDFTREGLPYTQMLSAPGHTLRHADQSGGDSGQSHSRFSAMLISRKMHFNASSEIEASLDRGPYDCKLFECDHD